MEFIGAYRERPNFARRREPSPSGHLAVLFRIDFSYKVGYSSHRTFPICPQKDSATPGRRANGRVCAL
jgi:hypothetical protein